MGEPKVLRARGLYLDENQLSEAPEGALTRAVNAVIHNDGVIRPRKGMRPLVSDTPMASALFDLAGSPAAFDAATGNLYQTLFSGTFPNETATLSTLATGLSSLGTRMMAEQVSDNLFLTDAKGILWAGGTSAPYSGAPGVHRCGDVTGVTQNTTTGTWLANGSTVVYRAALIRRDDDQVLMTSSPGGQFSFTATALSWLSVSVALPKALSLDTTYYVQLYRSYATIAGVQPLEELYLCAEVQLDSTSITNGSITISDYTPETMLGQTAYWSPSQGGIGRAREMPPRATDICSFRQFLFATNTGPRKPRVIIRLLGLNASAGGLQVGDTVGVGYYYNRSVATPQSGVSFTGAATQDATHFQVFTAGTPAQNLSNTARSIVSCINLNSTNFVATYLESLDDPNTIGQFMVEMVNIDSQVQFGNMFGYGFGSSRQTCWSPNLSAISGFTGVAYLVQFDWAQTKHRVQYSEAGIPSAWPLLNYFDVGGSQYSVTRLKALGDSLFIFKQKGLYRMTGTDSSNFRVDIFDASVDLLSPDSVAVVDGAIYCWTTLGVLRITESGKSIVSTPIASALSSAADSCFAWGNTQSAWATGRQREHQYMLWLPVTTGSVPNYQAYVYSTLDQAWTMRNDSAACGYELEDGRLILGTHQSKSMTGAYRANGTVSVEQRYGNMYDYHDGPENKTITLTAPLATGDLLAHVSDSSGIQPGDSITYAGFLIRCSDVDTGIVYFDGPFPANDTSGSTLPFYWHIPFHVVYATATVGAPEMRKHFGSCSILARESYFHTLHVGFGSDIDRGSLVANFNPSGVAGIYEPQVYAIGITGDWSWALAGAVPDLPASAPMSGSMYPVSTPIEHQSPRPLRTYITQQHRRCSRLYVGFFCPVALDRIAIEGVALSVANSASDRTVR